MVGTMNRPKGTLPGRGGSQIPFGGRWVRGPPTWVRIQKGRVGIRHMMQILDETLMTLPQSHFPDRAGEGASLTSLKIESI